MLNGIETGSGKSAVISMLAHKLALEGKNFLVITTNDYLQVQLKSMYGS